MKQKPAVSIILFSFCVLVSGSVAEDQPQKRVMNFLAVMDLNCGTALNKENCTALTNIVIDELVKLKKYTVIDRANRDKILSEAGFQQAACVDESCTIEMGRQLGVGKLVVGSITMIGETYLINLQLLNVETAAVETSDRETCEKCKPDSLINTVANATRKIMGEAPVAVTPPTPAPTSTSTPSPTSPPPTTHARTTPASYPTIFAAAKAGDIGAVKKFLDKEPGLINARDPTTVYTPLHYAVEFIHFDLARYLIERGADINARGGPEGTKVSVLHMAVMGCNQVDVFPIVELLISKGADVNARAAWPIGKPLRWAAKCNDKHIYDLLKQHGAK